MSDQSSVPDLTKSFGPLAADYIRVVRAFAALQCVDEQIVWALGLVCAIKAAVAEGETREGIHAACDRLFDEATAELAAYNERSKAPC